MRLKIYKTGFENESLNINNHIIKFDEGYAEVSDSLGEELIKDHPNLFKAPEIKIEKKVDLNSKLLEIENLQQQLIRYERETSRLKDLNHSLGEDLQLWKKSYSDVNQEIKKLEVLKEQSISAMKELDELKKENDELKKEYDKVIQEYKDLIEKNQNENNEIALEDMNLSQLKKEAKKLNIDISTIKRKNRKEDWLQAILDYE